MFGAMSALASAAVLVVAVIVNPGVWAVMGSSPASASPVYIVCELNDKSTNETRARADALS